jgi:hypothetical protein
MALLVWDIPTVKATTTDDRRRIVMPENCPPRVTVTIQDLDKNTWLVRRVVPERSVKMIPIPVIKKLPDDPEWEKTEAALARYAAGKLPPPEA